MQLYVPLNSKTSYDETRPFAQAIAQIVAKQNPDEVLAKMGKKTDRSGKVLIDWYQNNERKTTIAVYSLRARERPTCSTPVTWDEVEAAADSGDGSDLVFETADVLKRLDGRGDLFAPVLELEQELPQL
jgi:bifunctional non-homologous end joining protein LigD